MCVRKAAKIRAELSPKVSPLVYFCTCKHQKLNNGQSAHFIGQPLLRQIINFPDKDKVLRLSRKHGREHYVKRFDGWQHLVVMLYAVIMR